MVTNPAVHELNNIEVRGGDSDYQVVSTESGEKLLLEYDADADSPWRILGRVDLDGNVITNAGHDGVQVPQVRELTVDDWESGTLDEDVWTQNVDNFTVQSSVVQSNQYAIEAQSDSDGSNNLINSLDGLGVYPQAGDVFEYSVYLTSENDECRVHIGKQEDVGSIRGYMIRFDNYNFTLFKDSGSLTTLSNTSNDLSQILNEWIRIVVDWGINGEIVVTAYDSSGNNIGEISATDETYKSGGIGLKVESNASEIATIYYDSLKLKRRTSEYFGKTKKGTTELGNEVTPSGGIHVGALEAPTNALRAEYANAPVTDDATQGDQSLLTLLRSGINPAMYMERTMDGQGGAYGHQFQAALGRFARKSVKLGFDEKNLTDVQYWDTGNTNFEFSFSGNPRRIELTALGNNSDDGVGGYVSNVLTTPSGLGAFAITFHDVSFNYPDADKSRAKIGVANNPDATSDPRNHTAVYVENTSGGDFLSIRDSGSLLGDSDNIDLDFSNNLDITITYNGQDASVFINGVLAGTASGNISGDLRPVFMLEDRGIDTDSVLSTQDVTVEPLPEVLN